VAYNRGTVTRGGQSESTAHQKGRVHSVNVSEERGVPKQPRPELRVDELGALGDAHRGPHGRQLSMLAWEDALEFSRRHRLKVAPGDFAENVTLEGIDARSVGLLDRLRLGPEVEIEITARGKECHRDGCAIFRRTGACIMPGRGLFGRVVRPGIVRRGDAVIHLRYQLSVLVIVLSTRAYQGVYEDRSGVELERLAEQFFRGRAWSPVIERIVLPDNARLLRQRLRQARRRHVDIVFTCGSTGVGPYDIAPGVVCREADRLIPGVMEAIRLKYGAGNPRALLSCSVAAVMGRSLVYALPGSPRAVREYWEEISKTVEHAILMVHGVDAHGG